MKISDFERVCDEHDKLTEQVATLSAQLAEAQGEIERQAKAMKDLVDLAERLCASARWTKRTRRKSPNRKQNKTSSLHLARAHL